GVVDPDPTKTFNYYEASQSPEGQAVANALVSADRHSTIMPVTLIGELEDVDNHTDDYKNVITANKTDDVQGLTVGDLSINDEFNTIVEDDLTKAEGIGIPAALIILVVV